MDILGILFLTLSPFNLFYQIFAKEYLLIILFSLNQDTLSIRVFHTNKKEALKGLFFDFTLKLAVF